MFVQHELNEIVQAMRALVEPRGLQPKLFSNVVEPK